MIKNIVSITYTIWWAINTNPTELSWIEVKEKHEDIHVPVIVQAVWTESKTPSEASWCFLIKVQTANDCWDQDLVLNRMLCWWKVTQMPMSVCLSVFQTRLYLCDLSRHIEQSIASFWLFFFPLQPTFLVRKPMLQFGAWLP